MLQGWIQGPGQQPEVPGRFRQAIKATLILDTGPWVALHCRDEQHHGWATQQFAQHAGPFLTCEAVVTETCFLLARDGFNPAKALAILERGVVRIGELKGCRRPMGSTAGRARA